MWRIPRSCHFLMMLLMAASQFLLFPVLLGEYSSSMFPQICSPTCPIEPCIVGATQRVLISSVWFWSLKAPHTFKLSATYKPHFFSRFKLGSGAFVAAIDLLTTTFWQLHMCLATIGSSHKVTRFNPVCKFARSLFKTIESEVWKTLIS